jgi:hypothetical protein
MARAISSLARTGLAADEHSRLGGGDGLHLLEHAAQRGAVPHDVLKVALAADLVFQIQFLLSELVLEGGDLAIGEGVVDGDGHLVGDLGQERDLLRDEGMRIPSAETQHAQAALAADQWQEAVGLKTLSSDKTADLGRVGSVHYYGLPRLQCLPGE